ncbi:MAG: ABC transporter ATP-binding protein/permease [Clostridia bacterium]|nr:ABC transporter ATP-binding protein/permease [Clostridia bacterium]
MLELKNIVKEYYTQDETVRALKGVSLKFRKSEFVSILGPSGCGKTTMLNIVGGLDRYTSGDLVINGKSTKDYTDKEWDTYRNHSVGFVFQSYNLIPHQTVVENVELALTLSGIGKEERRKRAVAVLAKVGLENKLNSRPNQLSGGQMQRVAIARALINDPEILLADEPTGALDSKTSAQIMELLKEISKDRLIVMVTHNPEIAEKYSTRIIKMLDGEIVEDPNPVTDEEEIKEREILSNEKRTNKGKSKTSMSFFTALSLSLKNLLTKKARTILVSFAGSIGIIGIALILSLSAGFQAYINNVQKDTLSNYPVTIESETSDMSKLIGTLGSSTEGKEKFPDEEVVKKDDTLTNLVDTFINSAGANDLKSFKTYLETSDYDKDKISSIQYVYNLGFYVHGKDVNGDVSRLQSTMEKFMQMMNMTSGQGLMGGFSSMMSLDAWSESIDNLDLVKSQYDLIGGNWSNYDKYDEVLLVLDSYNQVPDYVLPALGLLDEDELLYPFAYANMKKQFPDMNDDVINMMLKANGIDKVEPSNKKISFEDVLGKEFYITLPHEYYEMEDGGEKAVKKDGFEYNESRKVKIVGIVRPKEGATGGALNTNLIYTKALTDILIESIENSNVISAQKANPMNDILTGQPFVPETNVTYETRLNELGDVDKSAPESINIYATTFEDKDYIVSLIDDYNKGKEEKDQIKFNDYLGTMMSGITDIINAISYILIGFVSVSLIVSSIMIGIITYISVLERIKEIGVLRALGASKKDVSRVFNAETLIIGFTAGILGIGITILLNIPISLIIQALAGIANVASLPWVGGVALVVISMVLTLIAGLIPAKIASKKDPVIALRTE